MSFSSAHALGCKQRVDIVARPALLGDATVDHPLPRIVDDLEIILPLATPRNAFDHAEFLEQPGVDTDAATAEVEPRRKIRKTDRAALGQHQGEHPACRAWHALLFVHQAEPFDEPADRTRLFRRVCFSWSGHARLQTLQNGGPQRCAIDASGSHKFFGVVALGRLTYVASGMTMSIEESLWALTEKEKQTLRLIVRGHDAKSSARSLGLSVHTINERLRDARRKMAVSSSRAAARMLLEAEGGDAGFPDPQSLGDAGIGEDAAYRRIDQDGAPIDGVRRAYRQPRIIIGALVMTLFVALLAFVAVPQIAPIAPAPTPPVVDAAPLDAAVVETARQWLTLLDAARWEDSYRATGTAFRRLNTAKVWAATSEKVRVPLGAAISRTVLSQENLPAPPSGYEVVKLRTRFLNKADAIETVTLDREDGQWRVVGVMIG